MKTDKRVRPIAPVDGSHAAAGDLMRVFSVFMVGWYHIWQQSWLSPVIRLGPVTLDMSRPVRAGYMFVDLMLLLSGFLLYLPYANRRERPVREFYARRALRILPGYWFCLAVMLALAVASPDFSDPARLGKDLLAHLTFTHDLFPLSYTQSRLNVVLWTLAVEAQFYLLLPLIAPVFRRRPLVCYGIMVGAALCFQRLWTAPMADTTHFVNRLPNMLDVYANGMLAAHIYAGLAGRKAGRGWIALAGTAVCALAAWGLFAVLSVQAACPGVEAIRLGQLRHRWLFSALGGAFLVGGSLSFGPVRALLSNRVVRFFSGITFSFYIWHQWLAVRLKAWRIPSYLAEHPNQVGEMPWQRDYTLLCFAAAILAAMLLTYLLERPAARWGRRRLIRNGKKR